jgi:hypothetical protein
MGQNIKEQNQRWRPFEEARNYARSLNLNSIEDWRGFIRGEFPELGKKPSDIPVLPAKVYPKHCWQGYDDWLRPPSRWRPFEKARKHVRKLKLKSFSEWRRFAIGKHPVSLKPSDIPRVPSLIYGTKWKGYDDWLGVTRHMPYRQAEKFARRLQLKFSREWPLFLKGNFPEKETKPHNIPSNPNYYYRNNGWVSWGNFLGFKTKPYNRNFSPFEETRNFARSLGLRSNGQWRKYCKNELPGKTEKPIDIPANPNVFYKGKGWVSWLDWLGNQKIAFGPAKQFKTFEDARDFARTLNLKSLRDWKKYCSGKLKGKVKRPGDIPSHPYEYYKDKGWISWADWVGVVKIEFLGFEEARRFARTLNLRTSREWISYAKGNIKGKVPKPANIPAAPELVYKGKGWKGVQDFLGYTR